MLATPTSTQIASALAVVRHPERFEDQPSVRALAWATLMATRGHRMNQIRIGQMQRAQRAGQAAMAEACRPVHITIRKGA